MRPRLSKLNKLYIYILLFTLLLSFYYTSNSLNSQHYRKKPKFKYSSIDCEPVEHACVINNLFYVNKTFYIYVNSAQVNLTWLFNDVVVFTGIGFGSMYLRPWHTPSMGKWPFQNELSRVPVQNVLESPTEPVPRYVPSYQQSRSMPIYVHLTAAPENSLPYHHMPVVAFSVLWPNLFRTIYAGAGAVYTLMRNRLYFPDHIQMILLDKKPYPDLFINVLNSLIGSKNRILWWDQMRPGIYKAVVLGISRDVQIDEISLEKNSEWRFGLRNLAFKTVASKLKSSMKISKNIRRPSPIPNVLLILRDGNTRQILNENELIRNISGRMVSLTIKKFAKMSLKDQIMEIDSADIVISMHGAALSHILFMRPNTCVIELFPYMFKKFIFQNIAEIANVSYLSWQNGRFDLSRTRYDLILKNKFTNMTKSRIESLPIDWYNMDSKNYWRNQDTIVDNSFYHVLDLAIQRFQNIFYQNATKYLIYTPWEQFNNQIIGFKSACALANILNRTLVLPQVGFPKGYSEDAIRPHFQPLQYEWRSFEKYFDMSRLDLPCSYISFDNFYSLFRNSKLGNLRYHHINDESTSEQQVIDYYNNFVQIPHSKLEWDLNATYMNSKNHLIAIHGRDNSDILALGSMFWYYDFGIRVNYPLKKYYDYFSHRMYKKISKGLQYSEKLITLSGFLLKRANLEFFTSAHIRRGDYSKKCVDMLPDTPASKLIKSTMEIDPRSAWESGMKSREIDACFTPFPFIKGFIKPIAKKILYISTNGDERDIKILKSMKFPGGIWNSALMLEDILPYNDTLRNNLDPIELSILDQLICIKSVNFVGNLYSSFSRHIIEARDIINKTSQVFK